MTESTTKQADSATSEAAPTREVVLQRLVFPADADFDTLPLYAELGDARPESEPSGQSRPAPGSRPQIHPDAVLGRRSLQVAAGTRVSLATYFNGFPAGYWRRWTSVEKVRLRVELDGAADVLVYRSNARGDQQRVAKERVEGDKSAEFELPLDLFGDGGWYWFDVVAGVGDVTITGAEWSATTKVMEPGRVSVGITTFNRPRDCVELLQSLASETETLNLVDTIYVIDQGTQKVQDDPGFDDAAAELGLRLQVIDQANLGGSGGFSRAMYEASTAETSKYVLLLDDDLLVEPEGILRAATFADLCRKPTIIGGHMLNMHVKSMLHAFGEKVNRYRFFWGAAPHTEHGHDFAVAPLRSTRWLHRRIDVDYNGWWMCLIPTDVVRSQGLSLPVFIKWDDADFGLRAKKAGIPTVSMPGAAVWHVHWADKDDTIDWQAYYHARNRILAALLHSPYRRGGRLVRESLTMQIKHTLSMQYSTAELRLWALEDILSGPDHLHRDLPTKLGQIRAFRAAELDSTIVKDPMAFPTIKQAKPPRRGKDPTEPRGRVGIYASAATGMYRQFRSVRSISKTHPEANVPAVDVKWWLLSQFDSAVVSTADGSGAAWYKRDPKRFTDLMQRSIATHQQLTMRWDELAKEYRKAVPEITGTQAWLDTWKRTNDPS